MTTKKVDLQIEAYISEFEKCREDILHHLNTQQQYLLFALGSVSVVIPILLSQTANIFPPMIALLLYALSFVLSVMGINFASAAFSFGATAEYIRKHLEPNVNKLLETKPDSRVFYWESFIRKERSKFITIIPGSFAGIGSAFLIMMPSILSLLTAHYVMGLSIVQPTLQSDSIQLVSSLLLPFSIIAWAFFVFSALSVVFSTIYHIFLAKWFSS